MIRIYRITPLIHFDSLTSYDHKFSLFLQDTSKISCSLVQLPKTAIAVSDDIAVFFSDVVPMIWSCTIAENGDIVENSDNT